MNREWVSFHLQEARDEITKTLAEIEATPDYGYGEFWVAMQHLYHHLNTAWNSREATADQVARASDLDFNRWGQMPTDLPTLKV